MQDAWKVNRRLAVHFGLRYEIQEPRTERYNRFNYFDFNATNPLSRAVGCGQDVRRLLMPRKIAQPIGRDFIPISPLLPCWGFRNSRSSTSNKERRQRAAWKWPLRA